MADATLVDWVAKLSRVFSAAGVEHALAGGLAVAVWARPRATVDIDLVILGDADSIAAVRAAGTQLGLLQTNRRITKFRRARLLRMAIPPTTTRETISIDLLLVDDGLAKSVMSRASARRIGGIDVPVVSAEDLILLKLLRLSDQDRADIRAIASEQRLDKRYLHRWAKRLRILTALRRVRLR